VAITNEDGIVTPDEKTKMNPIAYLAAMADSISQGIGKRIAAQEAIVGLKASVAGLNYVQNVQPTIAPFELTEPTDFVEGMEFAGGVATIITPGIYSVSACATLDPVRFFAGNEGRSVTVELRHNNSIFRRCEIESSALFWQTASADSPIRCVEGDTLSVTWYSANEAGDSPGTLPGARLVDAIGVNMLSITLTTPTG
jgi:hypothetical protein